MSLYSIPYVIPVLSGKGGVGKSSVTVQLALSLCLRGYNVGVLDVDLTGPSTPRLFGIESSKIRQAPGGWMPVEVQSAKPTDQDRKALGSLHCMSLGFLLKDRGDAVIWRGPKKTAMVKQLLSDVLWPTGIQYLLIDTPPGTSDEHISLITNLMDSARVSQSQRLGAVVVTTPQAISTADVRKELSFCKKTNLGVLGVIENMAGYVCPCCGEITNIFSKGGGQIMAKAWGVAFLGSAPLDGEGWGMLVEERRRPIYTSMSTAADEQSARSEDQRDKDSSMAEKYTSCTLHRVFDAVVQKLEAFTTSMPMDPAG